MPPAATVQSELEPARAADIEALRPAWSRLAQRSGNLFATPEWLLLWWRHFGQGELELWQAGDSRGLQAILPLYLHAGTLRFLGHGAGDELGPVAAPERREAAARALRCVLDRGSVGWDVFVADDVPGDVDWARLTGARIVRRTPSPVVRLDTTSWDGFLASRSANFRRQARSRRRRLAAEHQLSFRVTDEPATLEHDLDTLFRLHAARWGADGDPAFVGPGQAFHREFAAVALARGWLRLHLLEVDGRPAAALLNFRFGGVEWFYQGGRDPAFDRAALGFVLHLHAIRGAVEDGLDAYRLLRGGEPYKYRFADRDPGVVTLRRERAAR